jgi:hypothetical protein
VLAGLYCRVKIQNLEGIHRTELLVGGQGRGRGSRYRTGKNNQSYSLANCAVLNKAIPTRFELYDNLCRSELPAHYMTSSVQVLVPKFVGVTYCVSWEVFCCVAVGMCELIHCLVNGMADYVYVRMKYKYVVFLSFLFLFIYFSFL